MIIVPQSKSVVLDLLTKNYLVYINIKFLIEIFIVLCCKKHELLSTGRILSITRKPKQL